MDERFEELFQKYSNDVFRLSYSYFLNNLDAKDIVQELFINFIKIRKCFSKRIWKQKNGYLEFR